MKKDEAIENVELAEDETTLDMQEVTREGIRLGWTVSSIALALAGIADYFVFGRIPYEMICVLLVGLTGVYVTRYVKSRESRELVMVIAYGAIAVLFAIAWILQLRAA